MCDVFVFFPIIFKVHMSKNDARRKNKAALVFVFRGRGQEPRVSPLPLVSKLESNPHRYCYYCCRSPVANAKGGSRQKTLSIAASASFKLHGAFHLRCGGRRGASCAHCTTTTSTSISGGGGNFSLLDGSLLGSFLKDTHKCVRCGAVRNEQNRTASGESGLICLQLVWRMTTNAKV
jgi:hypothetical protein